MKEWVRFALRPVGYWSLMRRSLTTSTVTLLLLTIVSLNIVWGYPWEGMFAACTALGLVGWVFNRFFAPRLTADVQVPTAVPVGQAIQAAIHLVNGRHVPAIELSVGFEGAREHRGQGLKLLGFRGKFWRHDRSEVIVGESERVAVIRSKGRTSFRANLCFQRRGIQSLPVLIVESYFPFFLFRATRRIDTRTTIAVTPRRLDDFDPFSAAAVLREADEFSQRLVGGESHEYTGSREYQVGLPVRRWDFGSWARLGKPIVREYQSPALRSVWLVVDMACRSGDMTDDSPDEVEHLLSSAATVIHVWLQRSIRVQMYLTSESLDDVVRPNSIAMRADVEAMQIRLAQAEVVAGEDSDTRLKEITQYAGDKLVMILSLRESLSRVVTSGPHVEIIRVALPVHRPTSKQKGGD